MTSFLEWFRGLSPNLRGAVFVMLGAMCFVMTDITVKFTGDRIHPAQMTLFRYAVGFLLLTPLFIRTGREKLKTRRIHMHFFRAIIASLGQTGLYYATVHLLLANVTAIVFSRPLFLTILAIVFLKETVGLHRWGATFMGFVGVLVMVRPFGGEVNAAWGVALVSICLFAGGLIMIRVLGKEEPPGTILFWYHIFGVLFFIGPAAYVWVQPTAEEFVLLCLIAMFTAIGMNFFVRGFAIGESSLMGPMEYGRIVFAAMAGYFIFHEVPDNWTWVGAAIIVASTLYITRREAKLGKRPAVG